MLTHLKIQINPMTFFNVYCNKRLNSISYKTQFPTAFILSQTSKIRRLSGNMLKYTDCIYAHLLVEQTVQEN